MRLMRLKLSLAALGTAALIAGGVYLYEREKNHVCCAIPPIEDRETLGIMSSLPLFWPLDVEMSEVVRGDAPIPWQREALEQRFNLAPLDTLSPIADVAPDSSEIDPLAAIERIAIIQPRLLTPEDNVALDDWVREGGQLLLVLDPALTGTYELPLGDPRRPLASALYSLPPVLTRWGLELQYEVPETFEAGIAAITLGNQELTVEHGGTWSIADADAAACRLLARSVVAQCEVGAGMVTVMADAALFERPDLAGESGATLMHIFDLAFPARKTQA
ncbi:MAG: hypothetical protein AAF494_11310 [Pseudomonadota bacterium]